eukprot:SAG22_NODE_382_length_11344_cov_41.312228_5_plen_181_part_00
MPPDYLRALPDASLGRAYLAYMEENDFSPDARPPINRELVREPELAYAMARYREGHDFLHVLTGLAPTVSGELALKALEAVQTGLPMASLSVLAGPISLHEPRALLTWWTSAAPSVLLWAGTAGRRAKPPHLLDIEAELPSPLADVRRRWGYSIPPPHAAIEAVAQLEPARGDGHGHSHG